MSDEDYNPYLPNGSDNRMDTKDGPGLTDFLPDVSGGYKATAGAPLAGPAGPADGDIVEAALKTVHDPEIPVNIYDLGLIYGVEVSEDKDVVVTMTLTTPHCPVAESMPAEVEIRAGSVPGVRDAEVNLVSVSYTHLRAHET